MSYGLYVMGYLSKANFMPFIWDDNVSCFGRKPSPDSSGKPFEVENQFLLQSKSAQRKLFGCVQKGLKQKSLERIAGKCFKKTKKRQNLSVLTLKYNDFLISAHRTSL